MLLAGGDHGGGIARRQDLTGALGPVVVVEAMGSLIPQNVANRPVGAAIKDVLLVGGQHGSGIAGGSKLTGLPGPVIVMKLIGGCVPEDMVDGPVGAAIEDVLLDGVGGQQGRGVARGGRRSCPLGPIVAIKLLRRRI